MAENIDDHPIAGLFPLMSDKEFQNLKADIAEHGQREWIELLDGKILDGRNRYRACCELGIQPEFCELEDCEDPVAHVLSKNLYRRSLTSSQRAIVGDKVRDYYEAKAKERQKRKPANSVPATLPEQKSDSRDAAGRAVGVGGRQMDKAKAVRLNGDASVADFVMAGHITLNAAEKLVKAIPDKRQQRKIVKQGKSAIKEAIREVEAAAQEPQADDTDNPVATGDSGGTVGDDGQEPDSTSAVFSLGAAEEFKQWFRRAARAQLDNIDGLSPALIVSALYGMEGEILQW